MGTAAYLNVFGSIYKVLKARASGARGGGEERGERKLFDRRGGGDGVWPRRRPAPIHPLWLSPPHTHTPTQPNPTLVPFFLPLQDLQKDGYNVGSLPLTEDGLMKSILNQEEAKFNSADMNVAYRMNVDE